MKKHNGMRPQDLVILLKIIAKGDEAWIMKDIAYELGISNSEVSESLNRSVIAGLIASDKKRVMRIALLEFLKFGLKYVYPQRPSGLVRGVATAHSAEPLVNLIQSEETYVWPYAKGNKRGFSIEPLHNNVPEAVLKDNKLHELLALVDAIRVGNVREQIIAIQELERHFN
jgi:predicted transcriptional regulator